MYDALTEESLWSLLTAKGAAPPLLLHDSLKDSPHTVSSFCLCMCTLIARSPLMLV